MMMMIAQLLRALKPNSDKQLKRDNQMEHTLKTEHNNNSCKTASCKEFENFTHTSPLQ